jgi:hypothetical protein
MRARRLGVRAGEFASPYDRRLKYVGVYQGEGLCV